MPIGRLPAAGGAGGNNPSVGGGTATIITNTTAIPDTQTTTWGSLTDEEKAALIGSGEVDPNTVTDNSEVEVSIVFGPGYAVCLVQNEDGDEEYRLCSSHIETGSPKTFLGFQVNDTSNGARPIVVTMRGTKVSNPSVTGGLDLVPGEDVYLSHVPGQVTQTPREDEGHYEVKVGFAVAADKLVIANDFRLKM